MNADVVVVGGGVIGTAVAWFLSRSDLKVTLVDRGAIAGGTSGRCDGNVLLIDKMPGFDCRLARLSQELVSETAGRLDVDVEWTRKGSLLAIESEEELAVARDFCGKLADEGLPVRILDRQEVHEDEPRLAGDIVGGMEAMCDGSLNPMALAYGLARDAKKRGAIIRTHAEVTGIRLDPRGRVESVETDGGKIKTPRVVNACGIFAPRIGRLVGVEIPIRPRQGQILVSERTFRVGRRKVMEFGYLMAKFGGSDYKRDVDSDMEEFGV
ncbi:MAG: FAD-binding oxidoreductase, partial [Desulfobacterales bacterium]|nr:FAD-binding oxidoreductase [Desulfobacterales bacterium]